MRKIPFVLLVIAPATVCFCAPSIAQTTGTGILPRASDTNGTKVGVPIPEVDARRRLDAAGYHQIEDLRVDEAGIWRATTTMNGKKIIVSIDAEGKVLAGG